MFCCLGDASIRGMSHSCNMSICGVHSNGTVYSTFQLQECSHTIARSLLQSIFSQCIHAQQIPQHLIEERKAWLDLANHYGFTPIHHAGNMS